jgi:hypothetical protein
MRSQELVLGLLASAALAGLVACTARPAATAVEDAPANFQAQDNYTASPSDAPRGPSRDYQMQGNALTNVPPPVIESRGINTGAAGFSGSSTPQRP